MRNLEEIHQAQNVEATEEYQQKFVGKVDPFAENKKKKVIKAKKIKFVAKSPEDAPQWVERSSMLICQRPRSI